MAQALRTQRRHLESSTALWTLSALALAACGGGGGGGGTPTPTVTGATFTGTEDDDILTGDAGNNIIDGGEGANILTGGPGADTFVITRKAESDIITDFDPSEGDTITVPEGTEMIWVEQVPQAPEDTEDTDIPDNPEDVNLASRGQSEGATGLTTGIDTYIYINEERDVPLVILRDFDDPVEPAFFTSAPTTITPIEANTPPTVTNATNFTVGEGQTVDIASAFTDEDGDTLTFTLGDNSPAGFTLSSDGVLTAATATIETGITLSVIASDGEASVPATLTINVVKPIDVSATNPTITLSEAENAYDTQQDTGVTISATPSQADHIVTGYDVSDDRFTVDTATGELSVIAGSVFDYETDGGTLSLTITANAGNGTDTSSGSVTVTLTLTNEQELFFDATTYINTLPENEGSYSFAAITASDANSTTRDISYKLFDKDGVNEDPDGFTINEDTGEISYSGAGFDFEEDDDIPLTVVATSGADRAETKVTIQLTDVDEMPTDPGTTDPGTTDPGNGNNNGGTTDPDPDPVPPILSFDAPQGGYTRTLDENKAGSGTAFALGDPITAGWDQSSETGAITLTLTGTNSGDFTISSDGVLYYHGDSLNYETDDKNFTFTITARDAAGRAGITPATTQVTITLTNQNDAPVAVSDEPVDFGKVERGGEVALTLSDLFTDEDGDNLALSVSDVEPSADISIIGTTLSVAEETSSGTYSLTLIATDDGTPPASETLSITLTVLPKVKEDPLGNEDNNGVDDIFNALRGTEYDDDQRGLGGDDTLYGSAGADILDGGIGNDTANYSVSTAGVTVNLAAGTGSGGFAAGDTYIDIENITGSTRNDVLIGDVEANELIGGEGRDIMTGNGGADIFRLEATGAANLTVADVITDFTKDTDQLSSYATSENTNFWYEKGVDAYGNDGANDTVIYLDVDKSEIFVILADYDGDIAPADFAPDDRNPNQIGTVTEIGAVSNKEIDLVDNDTRDWKQGTDGAADDFILHHATTEGATDVIQSVNAFPSQDDDDGDRLILPEGVNEIWVALNSYGTAVIMTGLKDEADDGYSYLALIQHYDSDNLEVWNGTTGNVVFASGTGVIHKLDEYVTGNGNDSASLIIANTAAFDGNGEDDVIRGGAADNLIVGNDGNDVIHGGKGNDDISAGTGRDWLHGGTGDDWLHGGTGADTFTGGEGEDTFVLEVKGATSLMAADVITDFSSADELTFFTATSGKNLWYERGVDAVSAGNPNAGTAGANDTVIYGDAAKTDIIVILADYSADITSADFEIPGYVGSIEML